MNAAISTILVFRWGRTFVIAVLALLLALGIERASGKKRSRGVTIFAVLLIVGSIHKLIGLSDYNYYVLMFQHLPSDLIITRYTFSIALRILGFSIAMGILMLNEFSRKVIVILSFCTILTIYWKHPLQVFTNLAVHVGQNTPSFEGVTLLNPVFPIVAMIFYSIWDIMFSCSMIYFFTRPNVKKQFM